MHCKIIKTLDKIPGGLLLVPLLIAACFNTLFPTLLQTMGGPTEGLFKSGTNAIIGLMLFACGATVSFKKLGIILKSGAVYAICKLVIIFVLGTAFLRIFGPEGIWGISAFAFIPVICYMNPGLFITMAHQYGKPDDSAMVLLPQLFGMPVWSVLIFNMSSGARVNWMSAVNVLVPFMLGMILGNLDPDFVKFIRPASVICLPLMGFVFGSAINLRTAFRASISGIALALFVLVVNFVMMYLLADRLILKRPGWFGVSLCATTGAACMDPALMAAGNKAYTALVEGAIPIIALVFLITMFATAFISKVVNQKHGATEGSSADIQMETVAGEAKAVS
jgi:2-keto-3-deoxygluconate permease